MFAQDKDRVAKAAETDAVQQKSVKLLGPAIILTEASLSFLGYGIPPPAPSWGSMLSGSGRTYMFLNPWIVVWPGLALSVVVYGVNMFGDAVRDLLDPRLRGGIGRYGLNVSKKIKIKTEAVAPKDL